jgi:hypothetical protein
MAQTLARDIRLMRDGLDLQGCLQYSPEGSFCAQGSGLDGFSRGWPGLFLPTYRRLRTGGERIGTLRTVGDAFRACGFAQ